jgi:hypothetical protein
MDLKSTHYIFQYSYFAGKERTSFINDDFSFDCDYWLLLKIKKLIAKTPELPEDIIKTILKKANAY